RAVRARLFPCADARRGQGWLLQLPRRPRLDPPPLGRRLAPPRAAPFGTESRQSLVEMAASVGRDERLRLFLAVQLPAPAVEELAERQTRELRGGRIVPRENLHITLAFLGSPPGPARPALPP